MANLNRIVGAMQRDWEEEINHLEIEILQLQIRHNHMVSSLTCTMEMIVEYNTQFRRTNDEIVSLRQQLNDL